MNSKFASIQEENGQQDELEDNFYQASTSTKKRTKIQTYIPEKKLDQDDLSSEYLKEDTAGQF